MKGITNFLYAANDPAALVDRKRNAATIGIRVLEADAKQGDFGLRPNYMRFLHAIRVPLKARVEGRIHDYPRKKLGQIEFYFG